MKRVCIFIDSGNFYHLVFKKLNIQELDFDFDRFANFLAGEREIIEEGKRFYTDLFYRYPKSFNKRRY